MTIRAILFDLDDTLYPRSAGVLAQVRELILRYMQSRLSMAPDEADALRRHYLHTYGTTMRGLQIHYRIDADEYLDYVHNIPLHNYLQPNPALDRALASLPQRKVIFTNASREHAERVLDSLGVRHHFEQIVDVRDVDFESKPRISAYRRVCQILHLRPEECVLVEDNIHNLRPARELGMTTVLVGETVEADSGVVDHALARIEDIANILNGH
jgi:putative hydrolase of the HAD superfamily